MTTIQGYPALVVILVLMLCVYVLGRTRGYRKAAKRYKAPSTSRALLTSEDLGVIGEIVANALNQALGYDPDCDDGSLVQRLCGIEAAIGSRWANNVQDGLQLVKSEIIEHVSQEIRAQDKRTIKRDSMRATRATKNKEEEEATEAAS